MSDIYNLLNNAANEKVEEKPRTPPEEYAKQKQQKRQNLYDMAAVSYTHLRAHETG